MDLDLHVGPLKRATSATYAVLKQLLLAQVHDGRWRGEALGAPGP